MADSLHDQTSPPLAPPDVKRVQVDGVDWLDLAPPLRLLGAFGIAIAPTKLAVGYALVLALLVGGWLLDLTPMGRAGEAGDPAGTLTIRPVGPVAMLIRVEGEDRGVFETLGTGYAAALRELATSGATLDVGWTQWIETGPHGEGVLGALYAMLIGLPGWLVSQHPWFALVYGLYALAVTAILGGALSRMSALHATVDRRASAEEGLRFAKRKWLSFFLALGPPGAIVAGSVVLMAVLGLLFNLPVLDVIGAVLYGVSLLVGLVLAIVLVAVLAGVHLLYPAVAVEGTDAYDANSRAFNYAFGRPWRYLGLMLLAVVYGAITLLFVTLLVGLAAGLARWGSGLLVFREIDQVPALDVLASGVAPRDSGPGGTAAVAEQIVRGWLWALGLVPLAYAVSYYFAAMTWVYLLLRQSADLAGFDDVWEVAEEVDEVEGSEA